MTSSIRSWLCRSARVLAALALVVASSGCGGQPEERPAKQDFRQVAWENDVELETLRGSVHGTLDCKDCHAYAEDGTIVDSGGGEQMCLGCHEQADTLYAASIHSTRPKNAERVAARCQDCHGAHDVYGSGDPRSLMHKRQVATTCSRCHDNPLFADVIGEDSASEIGHYMGSIHGAKLVKKGNVVAPSCVSCHGGHQIVAADAPTSRVSRANVSETCGECHRGVTRKVAESVHGEAFAEADENAPVCTSCHSEHSIAAPGASFKLASDRQCGSCHEERLADHLQTYHGRAHKLGGSDVAACYDCHGHHEVYPSSDVRSTLSEENRLGTCRSCHEGATVNFTSYINHGDPNDRAAHPKLFWVAQPMKGMLLVAFALFAAHTLLWLLRTLVAFLKNPREYRAARRRRLLAEARRGEPLLRPVDRFCHFLLLVSLVVLVTTGMPLKFHDTAWAGWIFALLGGADVARFIHKLGALMTFSYLFIHLASMIGILWQKRGELRDEEGVFQPGRLFATLTSPSSLLPGRHDSRAFWSHLRWFVGKGPEPTFGRYRYWEKLDYLALLLGIFIVGFTGLATWMPERFTELFPGWLLNAAQTVHSEEALLVAGFLLVVHAFHLLPRRRAVREMTPVVKPRIERRKPSSRLATSS